MARVERELMMSGFIWFVLTFGPFSRVLSNIKGSFSGLGSPYKSLLMVNNEVTYPTHHLPRFPTRSAIFLVVDDYHSTLRLVDGIVPLGRYVDLEGLREAHLQ